MTLSPVTIQITPEPSPSTPSWMGEVAAFAQVLTHTGILKTIQEQVHFARARFGHYDIIDFVAVLIGYVLSGEPTRLSFYDRLARQRALPHTESLPAPHRRARSGLRAGLPGAQAGEVVRTRTVILQAHTHQFLGTDCEGQVMEIIEENSCEPFR